MIRRACALVLASALLSACATAPPSTRPGDIASARPQAALSVRSNPHCIRSTGSLIRPPEGQCLAVPGSSYSSEELRRTGAADTADALRMLDPAVH